MRLFDVLFMVMKPEALLLRDAVYCVCRLPARMGLWKTGCTACSVRLAFFLRARNQGSDDTLENIPGVSPRARRPA